MSLIPLLTASAGSGVAPPPPAYTMWSTSRKTDSVTVLGGGLALTTYGSPMDRQAMAFAKASKTSGKHYFEVTLSASLSGSSDIAVGIANRRFTEINVLQNYAVYGAPTILTDFSNARAKRYSAAPGTTIAVAVDVDQKKVWVSNSAINTANAPYSTWSAFDAVAPVVGVPDSFGTAVQPGLVANFGATPFVFTPPAGYEGGWSGTNDTETNDTYASFIESNVSYPILPINHGARLMTRPATPTAGVHIAMLDQYKNTGKHYIEFSGTEGELWSFMLGVATGTPSQLTGEHLGTRDNTVGAVASGRNGAYYGQIVRGLALDLDQGKGWVGTGTAIDTGGAPHFTWTPGAMVRPALSFQFAGGVSLQAHVGNTRPPMLAVPEGYEVGWFETAQVAPVVEDLYWNNVTSLLHFDGDVVDVKGNTWNANGLIAADAVGKFGQALNPDNDSKVLSCGSGFASFDFGTGDLTVECWIYKTVAGSVLLIDGRNANTAQPWVFYINASEHFELYDGVSAKTSSLVCPMNQWVHMCMDRKDGTLRIYQDGVVGYEAAHNVTMGTTAMHLGGVHSGYGCLIDEFRSTRGVGRYGGAFIPDAGAFPAVASATDPFGANVAALLHFDNDLVDQKGGTFTAPSGTFVTGVFGQALNLPIPASYANVARLAHSAAVDISTMSHFTLEFRAKHNSAGKISHYMYAGQQGTGNTQYWAPIVFWFSGTTLMLYGSSNAASWNLHNGIAIHNPVADQWYSYSIVKSGSLLFIYVDGVMVLARPAGAFASGWNGGITFGPFETATAGASIAFEELRLTPKARYTNDSYSPALAAFANS